MDVQYLGGEGSLQKSKSAENGLTQFKWGEGLTKQESKSARNELTLFQWGGG